MISIKMPSNITDGTLDFLEEAQIIFSHKNKSTPDVSLRYDKVKKMSLFSQLLLYKFINYTATNRCFYQPKLRLSNYVEEELTKSGFIDLIKFHMRDQEKRKFKSSFIKSLFNDLKSDNDIRPIEPLESLKTSFKDNLYIAPLILLRNKYHKKKLEKEFINKIKLFYKNDTKTVDIVSKCLTEIYMNFWEHATIDTGTVMVAKGTKKCFELMFADNGNGIISTLSMAGYDKSSNILAQSVKRGVTSKPNTFHMGWGLWMVTTLCELNGGNLEIYSEGKALIISKGKTNYKDCGYWKGTIIHLSIPLDNPKNLSSLNWPETSIKINWG